MANIHVKGTGMPIYVGARAAVTRTENGVRIYLADYTGATEEIIAEAIDSITTNDDGSLTFTLPDGRQIVTDSLTGPQGIQGPKGDKGDKGDTGEQGPQGPTGTTVFFGTCDDKCTTREKTVVCPDYTLSEGALLAVLFTNTGIYTTSGNLGFSLNVNNTGSKGIRYKNSAMTLDNYAQYFKNGRLILFRYDGDKYVMFGDPVV